MHRVAMESSALLVSSAIWIVMNVVSAWYIRCSIILLSLPYVSTCAFVCGRIVGTFISWYEG